MGGLANRLIYAALGLLTAAGIITIGYRYSSELVIAQRGLEDDSRARAAALDQSMRSVQRTLESVAGEINQEFSAQEYVTKQPIPAPLISRLLRTAFNARSAQELSAFYFEKEKLRIRIPENGLETEKTGAAIPDAPKSEVRRSRWTQTYQQGDSDWLVSCLATIGSGPGAGLLHAKVQLADLWKYTFPLHTVESTVSLVDAAGKFLVDGEGKLAVGTPLALVRAETVPGTASLAKNIELNALAGEVQRFGEFYVAAQRIDTTGWFLVSEVPVRALRAEAISETTQLGAIVAAILACLWAGFIVLEVRVLRPGQAAGARLVETLNNLQVTFTSVSEGIALTDEAGHVIAANDRFESLLGLPEGGLRAGGALPAFWNSGGADGAPFTSGEDTSVCQFLGPEGRWLEAKRREWRRAGHHGSAIILSDITERRLSRERLEASKREAEESLSRLQQAQNQLVEAEKLAALGALVAGVAHEINTPIGVAVSAASTLTDRTDRFLKEIEAGALRRSSLDTFSTTLRESVDLLQRNLFRASELITNFKQVAVDRTSCQRRGFDLQEVVKETLMTLNPVIRKASVTIDTDIPSGIIMDGYPGPLGQIVTNFVTNAIMHAFEGRGRGRIELVAQSFDGKVVLQCRDDGVGMQPDILRHAFDPFFTTKLGKGGSGLGLHIVYTLITSLMGGEIGIDSRPGGGTIITITLPLTAPAVSAAET